MPTQKRIRTLDADRAPARLFAARLRISRHTATSSLTAGLITGPVGPDDTLLRVAHWFETVPTVDWGSIH